MLIVLVCCMTHFNTAMHFMPMSAATKINFWSQESLVRLTTFSGHPNYLPNASEGLLMDLMP